MGTDFRYPILPPSTTFYHLLSPSRSFCSFLLTTNTTNTRAYSLAANHNRPTFFFLLKLEISKKKNTKSDKIPTFRPCKPTNGQILTLNKQKIDSKTKILTLQTKKKKKIEKKTKIFTLKKKKKKKKKKK